MAVAGQHQQSNDGSAGLSFAQAQAQSLPGLAVELAWEHRIAQHPAGESAGFALERSNQVPVVDVTRMTLAALVRQAWVRKNVFTIF